MTGTLRFRNCFAALLLACLAADARGERLSALGEHWIATWSTAQQLTGTNPQGGPGGRTNVPPVPTQGIAAPSAAAGTPPQVGPSSSQTARPAVGPARAYSPPTFEDQTIRMVVRVSVGGRRARVSLSNMLGADPLEIGAARIGLHQGGGAIAPGADREITVNGQGSFSLAPGADRERPAHPRRPVAGGARRISLPAEDDWTTDEPPGQPADCIHRLGEPRRQRTGASRNYDHGLPVAVEHRRRGAGGGVHRRGAG